MRDLNSDARIWGHGEGDEQYKKLQCKSQFLTPKGRNQILGSFLNLGQATVLSIFSGF
jgi:hypothetical protein